MADNDNSVALGTGFTSLTSSVVWNLPIEEQQPSQGAAAGRQSGGRRKRASRRRRQQQAASIRYAWMNSQAHIEGKLSSCRELAQSRRFYYRDGPDRNNVGQVDGDKNDFASKDNDVWDFFAASVKTVQSQRTPSGTIAAEPPLLEGENEDTEDSSSSAAAADGGGAGEIVETATLSTGSNGNNMTSEVAVSNTAGGTTSIVMNEDDVVAFEPMSEFLSMPENIDILQRDLAAAEELFFQQYDQKKGSSNNALMDSIPPVVPDQYKIQLFHPLHYDAVEHEWHQKPFVSEFMLTFFGTISETRMDRVVQGARSQIVHLPGYDKGVWWDPQGLVLAKVGRLFGCQLLLSVNQEFLLSTLQSQEMTQMLSTIDDASGDQGKEKKDKKEHHHHHHSKKDKEKSGEEHKKKKSSSKKSSSSSHHHHHHHHDKSSSSEKKSSSSTNTAAPASSLSSSSSVPVAPVIPKLEYLSGTWLSKVYRGPYSQFSAWVEDAVAYVAEHYNGKEVHPNDAQGWYAYYPSALEHQKEQGEFIVVFFIRVK